MDKLLHERLREFATSDYAIDLRALVNAKSASTVHIAEAIANEIERFYIPRPRFEDGEPVQFRDSSEYIENIEAMLFKANGSFETHQRSDSGIGWNVVFYERGETIKRPTPKVLDADEVEIKAGQEVYGTGREQHRYIVLMPHDECNGAIFTVKCRDLDDEGVVCHCAPSQLTHEKPVFDAEGVRICKGDTVWTIGTGIECEVIGFDSLEDSIRVNTKETNSDLTGLIAPCLLTHSEPDSLEKLRDYVREQEEQEFSGARDVYHKIGDRLTALIDRGA